MPNSLQNTRKYQDTTFTALQRAQQRLEARREANLKSNLMTAMTLNTTGSFSQLEDAVDKEEE